jgi:uncharacterized protein (DUF433 family)
MAKKIIGRYIVADPKICHGKLTFKGTRIFVDDVLEMVAQGLAWDYIIEQWHGAVTKNAIKEAVTLSKESLAKESGNLAFA